MLNGIFNIMSVYILYDGPTHLVMLDFELKGVPSWYTTSMLDDSDLGLTSGKTRFPIKE